jgi:hypothetical protein
LKGECYVVRFFKSLLKINKKSKINNSILKNKKIKEKKIKKKKKINQKLEKEIKTEEIIYTKPKTKENVNVQMPAPWSKVEKYKRIKKDYEF